MYEFKDILIPICARAISGSRQMHHLISEEKEDTIGGRIIHITQGVVLDGDFHCFLNAPAVLVSNSETYARSPQGLSGRLANWGQLSPPNTSCLKASYPLPAMRDRIPSLERTGKEILYFSLCFFLHIIQ